MKTLTKQSKVNPMPQTTTEVKSIDMTPSEKLHKECVGCRVTFNWYRTSKQVDDKTKKDMATAADTNAEGFSASKRLMDSKHPVIKKANELQRRIDGFWKSQTVALAAFAAGKGKPEPGVRLINLEKADEFNSQMRAFKAEVGVIEDELNVALPDIKEMDRARLRGMFNETDYPDRMRLDLTWGFVSVDVPAAMEKLAPEAYQQECDKLKRRMDETYELATATVLEQFLDIIRDWVRILGPVVRIYPGEKHPLHRLHGAELREDVTHSDETKDLQPGQHRLTLRSYPKGSKTFTEETLIVTERELSDLSPSTVSSETRTFKDTTVTAMTDFLAMFRNISSTISSSDSLNQLVGSVEDHLSQCRSSESAAKELRNSAVFRAQTHTLMKQLDANVKNEIQTFKRARRLLG